MKAFYETNREDIVSLHVGRNHNYVFAPHFHSHLEFCIVKKGKGAVTCNGKRYTLTDGDVAIFDSYCMHGYEDFDTVDCDTAVVIVPLPLAKSFISFKKDKEIENVVISDFRLADALMEIVDKFFLQEISERMKNASVELFLTMIEDNLVLVDKKEKSQIKLIKKILDYIHLNFDKEITLPSISRYVGYTEAHVSRTFHQYLKKSIGQYLNDLRINYVKEQLKNTDKSTTELIYEAGFKSVQTYYRNLSKSNI